MRSGGVELAADGVTAEALEQVAEGLVVELKQSHLEAVDTDTGTSCREVGGMAVEGQELHQSIAWTNTWLP